MMGNSWALAILILLVILISCPMESDCEEEFYNSKLQFRQDYLSGDLTHSKRYSDIDYDTFVGLMGRRSAADMDGVFLGLLGRRSSRSAIPQPWGEEYPQPRGGILINNGRLRHICTRCVGSCFVYYAGLYSHNLSRVPLNRIY